MNHRQLRIFSTLKQAYITSAIVALAKCKFATGNCLRLIGTRVCSHRDILSVARGFFKTKKKGGRPSPLRASCPPHLGRVSVHNTGKLHEHQVIFDVESI